MTRPGAGLLPGGLDGIVSRGLLKSKVVKISCLFRSILRSSILNDQPFSAERKNGHFSVIPARTGSVVILGHFFMARTVPPSFVENGPKLRVLIPLS